MSCSDSTKRYQLLPSVTLQPYGVVLLPATLAPYFLGFFAASCTGTAGSQVDNERRDQRSWEALHYLSVAYVVRADACLLEQHT